MDEEIKRLVNHINNKLTTLPQGSRLLISVSGIPGSGKTTLAGKVVRGVNSISKLGADIAAMIPMDGYHLTRAALDAMPDPLEAHARRGAPFTFDPVALRQLVEAVKAPITDSTAVIYAPSFDHAIKDPVENDIAILKTQRVLVFEGNYLSLSTGAWKDISKLFDELWFVEVERDIARKRLITRHLEAGLADSPEAAGKRADENDLPNGDYIIANMMKPDQVIKSIEDAEYVKTQ